MTRLFPEKASESRAESAPRDVLVDPDAVRELSSGLSSYRDFIRQLPAHLSKHILSTRGPLGHFSRLLLSQPRWEVARSTSRLPGMLDRNTLNRCASVSQHWAALAHQVRTDLSVHSFIQHQLAFLQVGPSGRSRLPTSPSLRRGWPGRDPFRPPQTLSWPPAPGGLPMYLQPRVHLARATPVGTSQEEGGRAFQKPHETGSCSQGPGCGLGPETPHVVRRCLPGHGGDV